MPVDKIIPEYDVADGSVIPVPPGFAIHSILYMRTPGYQVADLIYLTDSRDGGTDGFEAAISGFYEQQTAADLTGQNTFLDMLGGYAVKNGKLKVHVVGTGTTHYRIIIRGWFTNDPRRRHV